MNILITGGSGFIGSHTATLAQSRGHRIHLFDKCEPAEKTVSHELLDVTAVAAQERAAALHPDAILHLAAHIDARASIEKPVKDFETNVLGTLRMLEAARLCDAAFVFSSSAAVYGNTAEFPITEDAPLRPANPYGASKVSCEILIRQYAATYGLRTVVFRYSNIFGPAQGLSDGEAAVVPGFIRAALDGRPITIFGDGAQTRDFVHVTDVANANLLALEDQRMRGTYHVSSGGEVSIARLATMIKDMCQSTSPLMHVEAKRGDIERSVLDNSRLKKLMTIPSMPFHAHLKETCAWYARKQAFEIGRRIS